VRPSKRVDILPPQASRQHGPRLLALAVCRVAANGQPERARPLPGAQGDIGRTGQIIAEGEQAGQEQLAERPAAYLRCASVKVMRQEYPAHLTFGVYELETLADRLAYGDRGLLVGLKPARDCIRARDGLAGLIAKPVDGRCDIRRHSAGTNDADSEPQRLQLADERVAQRRQDASEEHVPRRLDLRVDRLDRDRRSAELWIAGQAGSVAAVCLPGIRIR